MKYFKKFSDHTNYENYKLTDKYIEPNLSYCELEKDVHFKYIPDNFILKFNITDIENPTTITAVDKWDDVEYVTIIRPNKTFYRITYNDLVMYDSIFGSDPVMAYKFDSLGLHTFIYKLKPGTTSLDPFIYMNSEKITYAKIPSYITSIPEGFFYNCINLEQIDMSNNITTIGDNAFRNCKKIGYIIFPKALTYIGESAFSGSISIEYESNVILIFNSINVPTIGTDGISINPDRIFRIYVPDESLDSYRLCPELSAYNLEEDSLIQPISKFPH